MAGLLASLRLLGHSLVDLVYPPICLGCDSEIDSGLVCRECRQRLLTNRLGVCPACGRPNAGSASCGRCRAPFCLARVRVAHRQGDSAGAPGGAATDRLERRGPTRQPRVGPKRAGAPGMTRTCDLQVRNLTLYPTELRALEA